MMCSRLLVLPALLALGACATPPVRETAGGPVAVPAAWQQTGAPAGPRDAAVLAAWWEQFHDPVLSQLITDGLRSSPGVNSALSRVAEFRARRGVEHASLLPALDASVSAGRTRSTERATQVTTTGEFSGASLDAGWQVDVFGRQRQTLAAASADLSQAGENYAAAQVALAADLALAYVTLRSAEAQLAVVQHSLGMRRQTVQLTRWQEQAGTGSALATQQALATLELAQAALPALQLTIAQTRNQLARLSGLTPGALDPLLTPPGGVPVAPADLAIGIPAETLRQRPDVRAAERGLEAAFARTAAARRQRLPSLTLSGSIGVEALDAGRLFNPATTVVSLLAGVTAPLFHAGRISRTITIQRELEQQARNAYASAVLTALSEVENALVAVQRHAARLAILTRATAAAREAARLAALQYQAGQVDLLVSLDAQRTLLDLEQQAVTTAASRTAAVVQLYQALGGGWSPL